jgi:hypothetical protein
VTQCRSANSYLYVNERLSIILNQKQMFRNIQFVFSENYYVTTRTDRKLQPLQIVQQRKIVLYVVVHLNVRTLSGPVHIKLTVQFCLCTDQHSFHCASNCFSYYCQKDFSVIHRCPENITLHMPLQDDM